jgi:serine/threonine-protein kinase
MQGVIVYTRDSVIAEAARAACRNTRGPVVVVDDLGALANALHSVEWMELVIDRDTAGAAEAAATAGALGDRRVISVVRDPTATAVTGTDVVVLAPVIGRALAELTAQRPVRVPSSVERLLGTTVLGGPLDDAIDAAAHEIATAFGVARCVISEHAELAASVQTDGATFDAQAWNVTAERCRAAVAFDATFVVPAPQEPSACDSYVAAALESPRGALGFVALQATGARAFTREERANLRALAARIGRELRWRSVNERTAEELDRTLSGPGLDPLLGIWNRAAMEQLTHSYASSAKRYKLAMTVLAVRVVDLEGVNTRYGVAMGDRLLRRIADALKPALRGEDMIGRYSGTIMTVVLQGTTADDAKRVADRMHATLAERSLEVPEGDPVRIRTTIGIGAMRDDEEARILLTRVVRATKQAPDDVIAILSAPTTFTGRVPAPGDTLEMQLRATLGGSYRLRHEISRGGMGVVYRADDLALERPVAIKMLRPELAQNDELVKHLRREAAMLARVHHPNLVQIYNFGQAEGDCYFVMELVEGESLQRAIERHREEQTHMPMAELLAVVDQIASALDALHERGIVHRDVKPANFIRDPFSGRSVLVDVGIAHRFGELSKQAGTPGFMAPEVIQGIPASARSDVYGLAASVFAMATLAPPWGEGEPIEIIMRQCNEAPPRPSSLRAELEPIDQVLGAALSFETDRRPSSAGAFARALSSALGMILPQASGRAHHRHKPDHAGVAAPRARGVVFQGALRALGVRESDRLRDALGDAHAELAQALAQCAPLAWAPADLLVQLLELAPEQSSRDPAQFARESARSAVRGTFRSFFPASPETLHPDRTLSAIRGIWSRYHTWGNVSALPVTHGETIVRIAETLRARSLCAWTSELLENLVMLSGGHKTTVQHEACELDGADACMFRVSWQD